MTRIDFYVLPEADAGARMRFACRLAHKAWHQAHMVYLHTESAGAASELDALLWALPRISFFPHDLWQPGLAAHSPVLIGHGVDPLESDDVLINLTDEVPKFFERFARVAEVVVQTAEVRSAGRERFKFYRERGYPLQHHAMQNWTDE